MDRFEDLHTFKLVAEYQSVRKAADHLHRAPSAVSRRIKDLEHRLNTQLLTRTTRQVQLTSAGERFLVQVKRILADLDEAEAQASQDAEVLSGDLRISMPQSFGLTHIVPVLTEFMALNPLITIEADLNDRAVDLGSHRFDVAIRIGHLQDSSLRARRLSPIHYVVAASPLFWKQHGHPQLPDQLQGLPALCYSHVATPQSWSWSNNQGQSGQVNLSPRLYATNGEALVDAAIKGLGVLKLPTFLTYKAIEAGELQPALISTNWGVSGLYALYPNTRFLPNRTRFFIDYLATQFSEEPVWDHCLRHDLESIDSAPPIQVFP